MSKKIPPLSYCFGAYNEEEIIKKTVETLIKKLEIITQNGKYEILVIENGSTDNTLKILKGLKNKHLRVISLGEKGHGLALKTAIEKAKYDHIVLTGADLPFGFSDLNSVLTEWNKYDILFGSKLHPKSTYLSTNERKIATRIYSTLLRLFFNLTIRDPQGSIFLQRKSILPILKYCTAQNAFFTTQLAIYAKQFNLKLKEIPVSSGSIRHNRQSKYKVSKDGPKMFGFILSEFVKLQKLRTSPLSS